jgi:hypothetical protein
MLNIFCCDYFSVEPLQRTTFRADGALLYFELLFRARLDNHFPGRWNEHRGHLRNCDFTDCHLFFGGTTKKGNSPIGPKKILGNATTNSRYFCRFSS